MGRAVPSFHGSMVRHRRNASTNLGRSGRWWTLVQYHPGTGADVVGAPDGATVSLAIMAACRARTDPSDPARAPVDPPAAWVTR